mgnify:FL=1
MSLNNTPSGERLHIGLFGRRNSGKSSLVNALTRQQIALVSDVAGTTTDPVSKTMEIHGIGPCVFIDTAGFDDEGTLGEMRVQKTRDALRKTDVALLLFGGEDHSAELEWLPLFRQQQTPVIPVISRADERENVAALAAQVQEETGLPPVVVSAATRAGIDTLVDRIIRAMPEGFAAASITGRLVQEGDTVLLVMPQDIQAPKGRLILPQVQTIRDLLDHHCVVVSATTAQLKQALDTMKQPPALIITDSQAFAEVYPLKPEGSRLTSFSVLFAAHKGDIDAFVCGAAAIDRLTERSRVLIAEACTHAPLADDIGREKIPALLRRRFGAGLEVTVVSGVDFPADLSGYNLIIHCGACMFNRRYVLARIRQAQDQGVPITNYGVALAHLTGILDKIVY